MCYAAVATGNGYVFCGGKPEAMPPAKKKKAVRKIVVPALKSADVAHAVDFVPSFISGKNAPAKHLKERLVCRSQRNRYRDFSVNDCPRKIRAKKEKRRNRKIWEQEKMRICAPSLM